MKTKIAEYRKQRRISQEELALALQRIAQGEKAEMVMAEFSHRLTQKLLHPTSIVLREAAKAEDPSCFEMMRDTLQEVVDTRRKTKH